MSLRDDGEGSVKIGEITKKDMNMNYFNIVIILIINLLIKMLFFFK
jgi:hypothetical protein